MITAVFRGCRYKFEPSIKTDSLRHLEPQAHGRALLLEGAQADLAAKALHDLLDHHQADAQPSLSGGVERFERQQFLLP